MNFRSNNMGVLEASGGRPKEARLQIVKYHPNRYLGLLPEYLAGGWKEDGDYIVSGSLRMSKEVFKGDEAYYTVAFVRRFENEDIPVLEGVEDRLAYLEDSDSHDFFIAYRKANEHLLLD